MADKVEYNLKTLIESNNKLWTGILTDMGYAMEVHGEFNWPFEEDFVPLTIQARHSDGATSDKITVYLHKCTFKPQEHHVLHSSTDVDSYYQAWEEAKEQSTNDTKIHFAPHWEEE